MRCVVFNLEIEVSFATNSKTNVRVADYMKNEILLAAQ
jgi:hypothetical protein